MSTGDSHQLVPTRRSLVRYGGGFAWGGGQRELKKKATIYQGRKIWQRGGKPAKLKPRYEGRRINKCVGATELKRRHYGKQKHAKNWNAWHGGNEGGGQKDKTVKGLLFESRYANSEEHGQGKKKSKLNEI